MRHHLTNSWNTFRRPSPIQAVLIAALLAAAIFCLSLVAPILWTALFEGPARPTLASCAPIKPEHERLACYDQAASEARSRPAKGGTPMLTDPDRARP